MDTARRYRLFADREARGNSPIYQQWARGVADDPDLLALAEQLPPEKRRPQLLFAAARYAGLEPVSFAEFRDWVRAHWDTVREVVSAHDLQTNEPARTALLLPALAGLPEPLALIEVGAAAGLCLYPDRYSFRYGDMEIDLDPVDGPSPVVLSCATSGAPTLPARLPEVVHRAGVDRNPLDVTDAEDMRWLECLVSPDEEDRLQRLRAAIEVARKQPPDIVAGDLATAVTDLVYAAPGDTTVVVVNTSVLPHAAPETRAKFEQTMRNLPCHWISNEAPGMIALPADRMPPPPEDTDYAVLALDGEPLAYTAPHGRSLIWFG
ncbi:DUF2332 domain-containing protein [Nocardia terpenica]|uniref:DUF2332 domain-containing protein n=1 Tax=Nocardia terpenica TaxID=455432 RepID=A0A164M9J7_9NOCA|nr:DUF2332 domain-containing protein [Nocardia terpenica]KZM73166.1 hypothetical protein AWN90_31210 [Nocardia terpenica]MBF6064253.1 DUF2332 domain-containing protein [Nocardia terpenica]MBF6106586.1 DUF2332 domain-containing protein [Nocardia terpenica]MBF6113871.1 DUF2332 domain-containing protein [Nocardia terpenica]MBF6120505.1 DUF2332 domain-containing protein [Nocardia terpenica]